MKKPDPPDRDYAKEMRAIIDEYRQKPGYNAGIVASAIISRLLMEDRELLYGWLEAGAASSLRAAIVSIDASTRAHAKAHAAAGRFKQAANEAEKGNLGPLTQGFLEAVYVVDLDNSRKTLRSMKADDVTYVADAYDARSRSAKFEAAFLRAIAARLGDRTVGEVFDNTQLAELHVKLTGAG